MMAVAGSFLFLSSTRTKSWNIKFLPYIYSLSVILVTVNVLVVSPLMVEFASRHFE